MATVYELYPDRIVLFEYLQQKYDAADVDRRKRFIAIILLQRMERGYLIRKYIKFLNKRALTIQCAFRMYRARKAYRQALKDRVRMLHMRHYDKNATKIQATWRGRWSRKTKFDYRSFKRWLKTVKERGERKAAEASEYRIRSRADDLRILENDARQWLAFVVFKLHHLLRTYVVAGVYSDQGTNELSEFEKLLNMIHYKEYMQRLRRKYDEFVRKHRPMFDNKRLFPVIGEGADYWYLSLPEMYDLTADVPMLQNSRHHNTHHGSLHPQPFVWRKLSKTYFGTKKGPFYMPPPTKAPPSTPTSNHRKPSGDFHPKDQRFQLYVKHYTPVPDIFKYVDYYINVIINRRNEILNTLN